MFLNRLNDRDKEMFLDLAIYASRANGVVEDAEKNMLAQYCKEMDLVPKDETKLSTMEEITAWFSEAEDPIKRIVVIELLGLYYADGDFDNTEKKFALVFAKSIGIDQETYEQLNRDIDEYLTIVDIIQKHIIGQ